ncbi:MAG: ABC transporter substrate-binding protein [Janthinobacterium lividum]
MAYHGKFAAPLRVLKISAVCTALTISSLAVAQKEYGPGVTDTEIKIGQTMPYSGAYSASAVAGRIQLAYFKMLNEKGGINGRKVNLISLDDGFSPPKTVEATRRLVESDQVLAIVSPVGSSPNMATYKYLNAKKVPQILLLSGLKLWDSNPALPWSMSFTPPYYAEQQVFAKYILAHVPNAKIGILYQDDDTGKELRAAFRETLGPKASSMIVQELSYNVTDTSVDSQILALQSSGANVFLNATGGKFTALALRKAYDSGWKPLTFIPAVSSSVKTSMQPAGVEASTGALTTAWVKTPNDPQWANDKGVQAYHDFMKQYVPGADADDYYAVVGFLAGQLAALVLQRCGDDLTRANVMKQATSLNNVSLTLTLPGITMNNSPTARNPVKQFVLARYDGHNWVPFGDIISAQGGNR